MLLSEEKTYLISFSENEIKFHGNIKDWYYGKMSYFLNLVMSYD